MGPVCLIWDATENKEVNGTVIKMFPCYFSSLLKRKLQHVGHKRIVQWVNRYDPPGSIGAIVS